MKQPVALLLALALIITIAPHAIAGSGAGKGVVLDEVAEGLKDALDDAAVIEANSQIIIGRPTNAAKTLTASDVRYIVDALEDALAPQAAVAFSPANELLSDDDASSSAAELAKLAEAGIAYIFFIRFSDEVEGSGGEEVVLLTSRLTVIDTKSRTKKFVKSDLVRFDRSLVAESFLLRDSTSFVLGTVSAASLFGSVAFAVKADRDRQDQRNTPTDANTDRRKDSVEQSEYTAAALLAVAAAAWLLKWKLDAAPRGLEGRYEYELGLGVDSRGPSFAMSWSLN